MGSSFEGDMHGNTPDIEVSDLVDDFIAGMTVTQVLECSADYIQDFHGLDLPLFLASDDGWHLTGDTTPDYIVRGRQAHDVILLLTCISPNRKIALERLRQQLKQVRVEDSVLDTATTEGAITEALQAGHIIMDADGMLVLPDTPQA